MPQLLFLQNTRQFKNLLKNNLLNLTTPLRPQSAFTLSLLLYIDPLANSYAVNRWSTPQLREIQLHCLSILANVIMYMKEE